MRANLLALQNTAQLLGTTQERLATGRKVNSPVDNAAAYFSAKTGFQKADDLSSLKNDMGEALQTVKTALTAVDSVDAILQQMKSLVQQAKATSDTTTRSDLAAQFDVLNGQLQDLISNDAGYKGINLLAGDQTGNDLVVNFNEDATSSITIAATDTTGASYAVVDSANDWADLSDITTAEDDINTAVTSFRSLARTLASQSTYVQTRVDFTNQLISTFKTGAENLVAADLNEEGANLLALQTSQQLSITALSLSSQAAQSVLRLF
jgi:flagellin-like hook-associated protein FlgL